MKHKLLFSVFTLLYSTVFYTQIELVKDINTGSGDSFSTNFITYKNDVYFTASKNFSNYLFKYADGNVEVVTDQNNYEVKSSAKPIELNGNLYLNARINNVLGAYKFDGTNFTQLTEPYFYLPKIVNNKIYFYNQKNSSNFTLWVTDGTAENTKEFLNLQVYSFLGSGYENSVVGDKLFFVGKNSDAGRELWVTDGTSEGTKLVKDINIGTGSSDPEDFYAAANGKMYFTAKTDANGRELYVTDGTESGTFMLKDFYSGTSGGGFYIKELSNKICIAKKNGATDGLYISDGTTAGTTMSNSSIKSKKLIKTHNDLLYFEGSIAGQDGNLIVSDGTLNGTKVLKNNLDYESEEMVVFKNNLYFRGNDGDNVELWKTDGSESGTTKVIDLDNNSALEGSFPGNFTVYNDELIFEATQFGVTGTELWKTDGTENGTQLIQDLATGSNNTTFYEFYPTENELLINLEQTSELGRELYKYEGNNTASIYEINKTNNIKIFYADKLHIKGLKNIKANLNVYNLLGKRVVFNPQISSTNDEINVNLPKGLYIVSVQLETGKIINNKIVID
ncbi:ELWxxDGT repeat protein [Polaribacter sp.]|uniref:ELWxxDGT repeat protein n=1 Tax=Polaribacter sp. TaxID=1920175 RepID=UPI003F6AB74D